MRIYNTLSQQKEEFIPLEDKKVRMYVCGPNLYGPVHIGHALSYVIFDSFKRYLKYRGYQVRHVQNFTDIEDRIIETAQKENTTIRALAEKNIANFFRDMDALNIQRADAYPRATETLPTIIKMAEGLLAKGAAYRLDGDIYFRVRADEDYGKLSHRSLDDMQAGARVAVNERKEDPLDFVLWKASKPGEPAWDSPWGPGRPGWHIECSAMNLELNGEQVDVHGGGYDVIFPHHENEIAQSESFTGKPFVKYWMHNALLHLPGQEKMTRHLGGLVLISEVLSKYSSDAFRANILNTHYRTPLAWTWDGLEANERGLERLRAAVKEVLAGTRPEGPAAQDSALARYAKEARERFIAALDDDFNSPAGLGILYDLAREINRARQEGNSVADLGPAQKILLELGDVFGLTLHDPERQVSDAEKEKIEALIARRNQLRAEKKYMEADRARAELTAMGVQLEDSPEGTTWRKVS